MLKILLELQRSHWSNAMPKIIENRHDSLSYDWKGELVAICLATIVSTIVVQVWNYWIDSQLSR